MKNLSTYFFDTTYGFPIMIIGAKDEEYPMWECYHKAHGYFEYMFGLPMSQTSLGEAVIITIANIEDYIK